MGVVDVFILQIAVGISWLYTTCQSYQLDMLNIYSLLHVSDKTVMLFKMLEGY